MHKKPLNGLRTAWVLLKRCLEHGGRRAFALRAQRI